MVKSVPHHTHAKRVSLSDPSFRGSRLSWDPQSRLAGYTPTFKFSPSTCLQRRKKSVPCQRREKTRHSADCVVVRTRGNEDSPGPRADDLGVRRVQERRVGRVEGAASGREAELARGGEAEGAGGGHH